MIPLGGGKRLRVGRAAPLAVVRQGSWYTTDDISEDTISFRTLSQDSSRGSGLRFHSMPSQQEMAQVREEFAMAHLVDGVSPFYSNESA